MAFRDRSQRGLTLIELMVAVGLLGVVLAMAVRALGDNQRAFLVVDESLQAQQNARVLVGLLESDLRQSGYMMPPGATACGLDETTAPDVLFVSAVDRLRTVDQLTENLLDADLGADVSGLAFPVAAGSRQFTVDSLALDIAADGGDFVEGAGVILIDAAAAFGNTTCGVIEDITGLQITANLVSGFAPGAGADVVAVPAHVYAVDGNGRFTRNGQVVADNVEDFQVAYFFDLNDNRQVEAGEYFGDGIGTDYAASSPSITGAALREVRVNVVVVTSTPDPSNEYQSGQPQATENRTVVNTPDGFRRRTVTTRVRLRNGVEA
ncbi:MAG: PilW family protein [Proteobacteria bacterium]|nr:PilW family protein [Pseudomonadota bacterium]